MDTQEITDIAINALENVKGENIVVLDTHKISPLFNKLIVCSGNSNRQVNALASSVIEDFKNNNIEIIGTEGKKNGEWILVDCGDVVIHIMLPQVRNYYNLETLWNGQSPT